MHKILSIFVLGLVYTQHAQAQGGAANVTLATPNTPEVKQYFYDGSSNLQYICVAAQKAQASNWLRSDSSLTSIAVSANTATATTASAHYLYPGARVTVSGATVDTDLNGTYTILTVGSSTTFTFTTVAVANATYTDSTMILTSNYPLLSSYLWAINVFTYTSTTLTGSFWADSNVAYNHQCSARATY